VTARLPIFSCSDNKMCEMTRKTDFRSGESQTINIPRVCPLGSTDKANIALIGMPGAGKSTAGVILAELTSRDFVDTDVLIQILQARSLQNIIDTEGHRALRRIEEEVLLGLRCHSSVIATGGSAVYSCAAMKHLKLYGIVAFLDADLNILKSRIQNFSARGLAKRPNQSFDDLFEERHVLYTKYADVTVDCGQLTPKEVCLRIIKKIEQLG
jgi:shikimate kinase